MMYYDNVRGSSCATHFALALAFIRMLKRAGGVRSFSVYDGYLYLHIPQASLIPSWLNDDQ